MKELSIEDKAKRYDEAIKVARKIKNGEPINVPDGTLIPVAIFPELKESEDERIKHEIKVVLANTDFSLFALDYTFADMLAWLEKQGNTNETIKRNEFAQGVLKGAAINLITWIDYNAAEGNMCLSNMECKDIEDALVSGDWDKIYAYIKKKLEKQSEHAKFRDSIQVGDKVTRNQDGVLVNLSQLNRVAKKQGEQKSNPCDGCINRKGCINCENGELREVEQKPADKIEPKFKVGDWIAKNDDSPINIDYSCCKITKVENGKYTIESIYGYKGYNTFETFENDYHLWTIQDANDGDVLAVEPFIKGHIYPFIAIFESRGLDFFRSYCFMAFDGNFFEGDTGHSIANVHPATKEQRDQLKKAMADAGYTFDFEKKELKKIEPKHADKEMKELLRTEYEKGRADAMAEMQKPWSEEDELKRTTLIDVVKKQRGSAIFEGLLPEELTDWLESLKNRVLPQPKSEWGEEDEEKFRDVIRLIEQGAPVQSMRDHYTNWLKSLKERYTWKPSDEQMKALADALSLAKNCGEEIAFDLRTFYEQLKKLK